MVGRHTRQNADAHCDRRQLNDAARVTTGPGSLLKLRDELLEKDKVRQVVRLELLLNAVLCQLVVDGHDAGVADENVEPGFALCKLLCALDARVDGVEVEGDELHLGDRLVFRLERLDGIFSL